MNSIQLLKLFGFSMLWLLAIYAANCILARKWHAIRLSPTLIYTSTMIALGLFGEITFDSAYTAAFGRPLWEYQLLPIHNGFTSLYSVFLWGAIGFHLSLLHSTLTKRGIRSIHVLATIFCVEAIVFEVLANISHQAIFHSFIYYYLPSDLWHVTSLQTVPLYLLAGYICVTCLRFAHKVPSWAFSGNSLVLALIIVLK